MNIQELAVIKKHALPIKIFIFNDQGYGMIKQTQDDWLDSKYIASTEEGGLAITDNLRIANAYGIPTATINSHEEFHKINLALNNNKCIICNVNISPDHRITPKLTVGKRLEEI